jgi:hypothetical protein
MTGRARQAANAFLVGTLLAPTAKPPSGADAPGCPSFRELGRRVDAKIEGILALKPGMPLNEFSKYASQGLNFWDDVGADKETVFFVGVTDGNAHVSDELVCRFGRDDRLRSCKRDCCRSTTRTINEAQYSALAVGDGRAEVERRLCSPSDSEADTKSPNRVSIYYHIDLPVGHHDEGQTVMLIFQYGRLASKGMSPYY